MQSRINAFFGQDITLPNQRIPFFAIVFMGILAIGSVLYWRHYAILAVEATLTSQMLNPRVESAHMQSTNYQIEFMEVSPTIK